MSIQLTANDVAQLLNCNYHHALGLLKLGDFKTTQQIGKSYLINQDEFLEYAKRKGIEIDREKLAELNKAKVSA